MRLRLGFYIPNSVSIATAEIISIDELLAQRKIPGLYIDDKYPLFQGKIVLVSGILHDGDETYSVIEYFPEGVKIPEIDILEFSGDKEKKKAFEAELGELVKRVFVPFEVNPVMFKNTNVVADVTTLEDKRVYFLKIETSEPNSTSYVGFQYLVSLD